jgi:hypothetical protein
VEANAGWLSMKWIFAVFLAFVLLRTAYANGLGGERLEKVVGDMIVDIGTDQTGTPVAGEPIEFDFNLLRSDTREPLETPTSVGLDIEHNGKPMVNGDLITESPNTFLFYTFPEGGTYTLKVTFFDSRRSPPQLATAFFPLTISGAGSKMRVLYIVSLSAACILFGLFGGFALARRRAAA